MLLDEDGMLDLTSIGLSAEALEARRGFVNCSEIPTILYGSPEDRRKLARYHILGEKEDLSGELPPMMGSWTELMNLAWIRRETGLPVVRRDLVKVSTEHPWLRATFDARVISPRMIVEAKHTNEFTKPAELMRRYLPQVQGQLVVDGSEDGLITAFYGNSRWAYYQVIYDPFWWDEAWPHLREWHGQIAAGEMPDLDPPPAPPPPAFDTLKEVDMDGSNAWAVEARRWLDTRQAAKAAEQAQVELKKMVPADARRAFGSGIEIVRNKARALRIKVLGEGDV